MPVLEVGGLASQVLLSSLAQMWVPLYLFLGCCYFFLSFRERRGRHLTYSILWFCLALYAFAAARLYSSSTIEEGALWQRVQMLGAIFALPTIALYIRREGGHRLTVRLLATMYGISLMFTAADLFTPWFITGEAAIKSFTLWGYPILYMEADTGPLGEACFAWGLILILASAWMGLMSLRQGRPRSLPLLMALLILVLSSINDVLVAMGVLPFVYLTEHSFSIFALVSVYGLQDKVIRANKELERQAAELQQANRHLQRLQSFKSNMMTNISHDLRTPLVSVRGYGEMIREGLLGPVTAEQREGLTISLRNIEKLLELIDSLMDYAQVQRDHLLVERHPFDLNAPIRSSINTVQPLVRDKGILLAVSLFEGPLPFRGNGVMMEQVFDNLLGNALKFTARGGRVSLRSELAGEGFARVMVADEGMGIPEEERELIFERFYQVHGLSGPRVEGIGLGLAVVREILSLHEGHITVKPNHPQGTIFEVALPLATSSPPAPALRESAAPHHGERTILIVEDEPDVAELLGLVMEHEGFSVQKAFSGTEALGLLKRDDFDLILLDLNLGDMAGQEIIRWVRGTKKARVPVLVLSAMGGEEIVTASLSEGCDRFLRKPVSLEELKASVAELLGEPFGEGEVEGPRGL